MKKRNFRDLLENQWLLNKYVSVGLDSDFDKMPEWAKVGGPGLSIAYFNLEIVRKTHDLVCTYKPNIAFYEAHGAEGLIALKETVLAIHDIAPEVPVILDAKRADIGSTNTGYVQMAFEWLGVDAITVHPYLGREALQPFLDCKDKGVFVLCRTSNPGAGEFQDIKVSTGPILVDDDPMFRPLYQIVAQHVVGNWNKNGNCGLVVGATYPDELREVRGLVGDMPILIPGIGAQGGNLEKTIKAGKDGRGEGMIINSSREIIFSDDPRSQTEKLDRAINQYR